MLFSAAKIICRAQETIIAVYSALPFLLNPEP
jgi:hypothetical protein